MGGRVEVGWAGVWVRVDAVVAAVMPTKASKSRLFNASKSRLECTVQGE